MDKVKTVINKHFASTPLMQLATVSGAQPWVCTLHFVSDDDLNIYWLSKPDARHSTEVVSNSKVAITVLAQAKSKVGLQMEGEAKKVDDQAEIERITDIYAKKHGFDEKFKNSVKDGTNSHIMYKFKPRRIIFADYDNFPESPKQEWLA